MFNKDEFIKQNSLNKIPFPEKEGLFISELTVLQQDKIYSELTANGIASTEAENKIIVNEDDYNSSIYLRVSFGLVDKDGNQVFTKEEIENLKDKAFVDTANSMILEHNEPKK